MRSMTKPRLAVTMLAAIVSAWIALAWSGTGVLVNERWRTVSDPRITVLLGGGDDGIDYRQLRLQCTYLGATSLARRVHHRVVGRDDGTTRCPFLKPRSECDLVSPIWADGEDVRSGGARRQVWGSPTPC